MNTVSLSLLVIRSPDIEKCREFYQELGLEFVREKHGKGFEHYACTLTHGIVFEIYPCNKNEPPTRCRIGLNVSDLKATLHDIKQKGIITAVPRPTAWGTVGLLDPDNRVVELGQTAT